MIYCDFPWYGSQEYKKSELMLMRRA